MKKILVLLSILFSIFIVRVSAQEYDVMLLKLKGEEKPIEYRISEVEQMWFVSSEERSFTDPELISQEVVPNILSSFCQANSHRARYVFYGTNTDVEISNSYASHSEMDKETSLAIYNSDPYNSYMNTTNNVYMKMLEGINNAAIALEKLKHYNPNTTNADVRYFMAEIKTIRAVMYMELIKAFGDVPSVFEPITNGDLYFQSRTDRDIIYKRLLNDLKEIEQDTPWPNETSYTSSVMRVSKSFVKGLRARIALFAGGYAYRADGQVRLSRDPELSRNKMYKLAYDECSEIINSDYNKLASDYKQFFISVSREETMAGGELLWVIPMAGTDDFRCWYSGYRGRWIYSFGVPHRTSDRWTEMSQGGRFGPTPTLWYDFDEQDKRRDVTCVPYAWQNGEKTILSTMGGNWAFGKYRFEWMSRKVASTNDDGLFWPYLRLSDVYMMAAETANELGKSREANDYLQAVLKRALPDEKISELLKAANTKDKFFDLVVEQRKLEFAGEMLRKQDLIRWGILKSALDKERVKMENLANRTGEYEDVPKRIYYNQGLDAALDDPDGFHIFGLNRGEHAPSVSYQYSKQIFVANADPQDRNYNETNTLKYIDLFYYKENNPDEKMYWPIWQCFVDASNGMITNYATEVWGDPKKYITEY